MLENHKWEFIVGTSGTTKNTMGRVEMTSVAVFWDIENYAPPSKMKGTLVEKKLREPIREMGPIRRIFAYAEQSGFPEDLRMELQRSGIHLIDTPHGRYGKDAADQMIITDMFGWNMK